MSSICKYWAHMDWFCEHGGLARVFEEGKQFHQDEYVYRLPFKVVERFDEPELSGKIGLIEYVGILGTLKPGYYRALWKVASEAGWGVLSTRIKGGVARTIELKKVYWLKREYVNRSGVYDV